MMIENGQVPAPRKEDKQHEHKKSSAENDNHANRMRKIGVENSTQSMMILIKKGGGGVIHAV
jgi:hypothetical protein